MLETTEEFCPAKVNLFLAVTGRRPDGFHDLVSVMAPLDVGDRVRMTLRAGKDRISLRCNATDVPDDERNLAWKAAAAFRRKHNFGGYLELDLEKNIPSGAGLGGGSSDAAGVLLGLNRLLGEPMGAEELHRLAAEIGSDCPFFLEKRPAVVRGRGERISPLPEGAAGRVRGVRLLLMKPSFGVPTPWAYGAMARDPACYLAAGESEAKLDAWIQGGFPLRDLLFNNMEMAVFAKYLPLPTLKTEVEEATGAAVLMSGSGSTLLAIGGPEALAGAERIARDALGESGWLRQAALG